MTSIDGQRAGEVLQPWNGEPDPALLSRHMDECVAIAVRNGVCEGAALAAHAAVSDRFADDLVRADHALVVALREILGLPVDHLVAAGRSQSRGEGRGEPALQS